MLSLNKTILTPTDQEIQELCRIINETLGFNYTLQKKYLFVSRLNKRLLELGIDHYQAYLALLRQDPLERKLLCELLTTNVTKFFREPIQFELLANKLLPQLANATNGTKKLRCWSAGCSSGEEAYGLAITCRETLGAGWDIKILATDINSAQLQIGRTGIFSTEKVNSVPEKWQAKYFLPHESRQHFQIIPELRKDVIFRLANLMDENSLPAKIRLDVIMCRNVFIYLSKEARAQILDHFYFRLNTGGYLLLGHSESIESAFHHRWLPLGKSIYKQR